jgi:ABC-type Fe3+/spermidine/putrescine transport system ATPase subunit
LSGGERQRVALARSLNCEPEILLLDEPLASLDRVLQKELQHELVDLNVELETTFIYVTHSLETALKLSDQIVVVNAGEIVQTGTPEEIYYEPVNRFVGEFMGDCNIFPISDARNISDEATLNGPEFETPLTVDGYADAEEPQYVLLRQHDCAVNPTLSNDAGFQVQIYNTLMEGEHYLIEAESVTTDRQYTTEMSYGAYQRLDVDIGDVVYLQWDIDDMIFLPE